MKKVLFIGITKYDLNKPDAHLAKKFEGLAEGMNVFVIARGWPLHKKIWNSKFYLIKSRLIFFPASFLIGCYLCATKSIDTIICQGPLTEGFIGSWLKIIWRKELVVEIHGDWQEGPFMNKRRFLAPLSRRIAAVMGLWALGKSDKIRTLTHISRNEIKSRFSDKKYFTFPTFTDIDIFLDENDTGFQNYILTAAVLSPIKSIDTLIESFSKIHNKFPDFKLVIVGDGPSRDNLQLTTHNLQLTDKVIFTGKLSLSEVKEVMKDCYMFVLPSLSEGFGRVFIEAMALAKPVIATNVGGVPEIVKNGKNGFLIEPKNADVLAEKIEGLLLSPELARKMGEAGRELVRKNFSNEKYIKNYTYMINA